MAHDKSSRFGKLLTSTPPVVGPGSYDIYEPSKPPRDLLHAYAFLRGTTRETLEVTKDARNLPGPGSYDPVEPRPHVPECRLGGVSIDFTDRRLKPEIIREGPGPEAYDLPDDIFKIGNRQCRSHPGTWRGRAGNLLLGKPPRSIIADNAASIPSKRETNGYEIKRGMLIKNPPCEFEPSEFYDIPRGEANFTTLRYKGNFWSMMTGRDEKIIEETPGPGSYETDKKIDMTEIWNEKYRSMKKSKSIQSRYLDQLWRKKILENYPAPNAYDLSKSAFEKKSTCDCDEYIVKPAAFGHRAKRFEDKTLDSIPGPGAYDPVDPKCSPSSKLFAPFGSCGSRFKRIINDSPGPGSYDLTKDDVAKKIFAICKRYPRGSIRKFEDSSGSITDEDATSEYIIPDPWTKRLRVYHAVFKSATSRFKNLQSRADTPGPGNYDPIPAFKATKDPCCISRRSASFASRSLRLPKTFDGVDLKVPGPGIYDIRSDISKDIKGGVISDATNGRIVKEISPGPQKYCFHPYFESSVIRRSHNVTLGKPKILQGPNKSKKPSMRKYPCKKILRWFAEPSATYEHCTIRKCG